MTSQPTLVRDLYRVIDEHWPFALAADWDRVGLIVGSQADVVSRVLLVVDVTADTVREAIQGDFDAVIAHHPLLLRGVTTVSADTGKGSLVNSLVKSGCALIAAHTNADAPQNGVADVFAQLLDMQHSSPIEKNPTHIEVGIGRVGMLPEPISLQQLAEDVARLLPSTISGVRVSGLPEMIVQRVALCPGAGDSLLDHPLVTSADVYITSDLRHHPASEAREAASLNSGTPALMDVPHFASEWLWLDRAAQILGEAFPQVYFEVSTISTDPWSFSTGARSTPEKRQNDS